MAQVTIDQAMQIAIGHHQAGRWAKAEGVYRQILAQVPDHADALHLLGVLSSQAGQAEAAIELISRAISSNPVVSEYHSNLGESYRRSGDCERAIASFRRAMELKPELAEAHNGLGVALRENGNSVEAVTAYGRAIELKPDYAEAHNNLGNALSDTGQPDRAIAAFGRAIELRPDYAEAFSNLGNALTEKGRIDEAIAACKRSIELKPELPEAYNNLGIALKYQGRHNEAIAACSRAIELRPDYVKAYNNLGIVLSDQGRPDEALAAYNRAIELKPDYAEAHSNLGIALKDQGRLDEALACFRRAMELKPTFSSAASNFVYTLHFHPAYDALAILAEHRRWDVQFAASLASTFQPHSNDPSPDRRLRIGYVSLDFRLHPVGRFILPLLEAHDHTRFEIFCYASLSNPDEMTARCRARADVWREVSGFADDQVARVIHRDRIDILVDLTMHMANGRLLAFARKPAPVQVTYLAYCGTTGLSTMDYRLTDPHLDPPSADEPPYSEESIHLAETYWCYRPVIETPPVNDLPAQKAGHMTFGCLNNFCKVSSPTLETWARLLEATPDSRLLLHAQGGNHRDRVRDFLAQRGIVRDRLMFVGSVPLAEYFRIHQQMDVALDPFPYGGGTTTCDALWMGVPVVTLAGRTAVGRGGVSILANLGLSDLVAQDAEEYVRIGVDLARDLPRLVKLRASLRDRMQNSPLMDAPRFAQGVEAAYRTMWQRWCARSAPPRPDCGLDLGNDSRHSSDNTG